jgi:hypothetical protein
MNCDVSLIFGVLSEHNLTIVYFSLHKSKSNLLGSSMLVAKVLRKTAASLPSIIRWSYVSARYLNK